VYKPTCLATLLPMARTTLAVDVQDIYEAPTPVEIKNINTVPHEYILADTFEKRAELINILKQQKHFCFDTETTGTDANHCELVGLSFAVKHNQAWYVPAPMTRPRPLRLVAEFKPVLEDPNIGKTGQNLKFDILMLKWYDVEIKGDLFDTMMAHYVIDPDTRHNMDILSENYLSYKPVSITELIGPKGKNQGNMRDVEIEKIKDYAAEDADVTLQLKTVFEPKIKEVEAENCCTK
jgi:DNA polymerase-1